MALDLNDPKYKPKSVKKLPVLLLLDVSRSMSGNKIVELHDAVGEMINSYVELEKRERVIEVSIITFGGSVELYTRYTPVEELRRKGVPQFTANGGTPMGAALTLAKDLIEDPDETPRGNYKPAVVLVSDGEPNDDWRGPLNDFISSGRTKTTQRFAVAIGAEADREMLRMFVESDDAVFFADNAKELADAFRTISTTSNANAGSGGARANPTVPQADAVDMPDDEDIW